VRFDLRGRNERRKTSVQAAETDEIGLVR